MTMFNVLKKLRLDGLVYPGRPQNIHLKNGLIIHYKIDREKESFGISRQGVFPSIVEWETVIKEWAKVRVAVNFEELEVEQKEIKGTYFLYAEHTTTKVDINSLGFS